MKSILENEEDDELIRLFIEEKQVKAYEVLFRRHYGWIYRRIAYKINDPILAEDICQILFIRLLKSLAKYVKEGNFKPYLRKIADNLIKDHWGNAARNREVSMSDELIELLT